MTQFSKKEEAEKKGEYVVEENFDLSATERQIGEKKGWKEKLGDFLDSKYFLPVVIILVAIIAFSLGRISGIQEKRPPVRVISDTSAQQVGEVKGVSDGGEQTQPPSKTTTGIVVGSKNGTKYHYPWCGGAKQISSKNLLTFDSIEEARASGYTPAANCKGLK